MRAGRIGKNVYRNLGWGAGQDYLCVLLELVKSVCRSQQDWSRVSVGACRTGKTCQQEGTGLVKTVCKGQQDWLGLSTGIAGIGQECLWE